MTRIKAFDPNLKPTESDRFEFLCNSSKHNAALVMSIFKDMAIGVPQPWNGITEEELAGIVGLYET